MSRRRRGGRLRFGAPGWRIAGGVTLLAIGAVTGVAWAGEAWVDRAAYVRGTPCADAHRRGCVVDTTAVVVSLHESSGKGGGTHEVRLRVEGSLLTEDLADPEEVWYDLREGMVVDVRMWEGAVTRVRLGGRATETNSSPVVASVEGSALALLALGGGLALLASGLDLRGYRFPPPDDRERSAGERAAHLLLVAGGTAAVASVGFDVHDPFAVAALASGAAATFALGRRVVQA